MTYGVAEARGLQWPRPDAYVVARELSPGADERCGRCVGHNNTGKRIAPVYDQLSVAHPAVKFLKVDIDNEDLEGTVRAAGISSVVCSPFFALGHGHTHQLSPSSLALPSPPPCITPLSARVRLGFG